MMTPTDYAPFPRRSLKFNTWVTYAASAGSVQDVSDCDMRRWRSRSLETLRVMGAQAGVLDRIATESDWRLSDAKAPQDVWCGELRLPTAGDGPPVVTLFRDSVWGRTPTRSLFEFLSQIGIDHMVGHLYPYYAGDADFGEAVACRFQYLMLRARPGLANWAGALVLPPIFWLHKRIPLSNYRCA